MSLGEITAWQAGVDWGRSGHVTPAILAASKSTLAATFDPSVIAVRADLGRDVFGYWFRRGLEDYHAPVDR